jgi:uncharacterized protein
MSTTTTGSMVWVDLTVADAEEVRDFYREVVGWQAEPLDMGGYSDFVMKLPATGEAVAGVCHARGANADLPSTWLMYVVVASLDGSLARCLGRGGRVIAGPKTMGAQGRYAVIADPAGAVVALFEPADAGELP